LIVGDGDYKQKLASEAESYGIKKNIIFYRSKI
jgi:hypothetical protein